MYYKPILVSCCEHSIEENSLLPVSVKQGFKAESLRMIVSFLVRHFFLDNGFFGVDFKNLGSITHFFCEEGYDIKENSGLLGHGRICYYRFWGTEQGVRSARGT